MQKAWSKAETPEARVKIWFGFLKMAIKCDLPLRPGFYDSWGTREELAKMSFNRWWQARGKALFEAAVPDVTLDSATDEYLVVRIPLSLKSSQIRRQVSGIVRKLRGSKRLKRKPPLTFVGDVNYKRLKQYERYLEIEMDPSYSNKSIEQKTERMRDVYRNIKDRLDKQRATLRNKGRARIAAKLPIARSENDFDREWSGGKLTEIKIRGITPKKVSRWRISGQHILLNVANGEFPGKGYYGASIGSGLQARLKAMGKNQLLLMAKDKGGGRRKEDRSLIKQTRTKAEREAESLKAYGFLKDASPVGHSSS